MTKPKAATSARKRKSPAKKTFASSGLGSAMALGAAAHLGSRLIGSIFNSAPIVITIDIQSTEVTETISLKTRGLNLTIKPQPETEDEK